MGVSVKDVLKLAGIITATGLTGGTAAALAPGFGLVAGLLGDDDDDESERTWRVKHIGEWMGVAKRLMDVPMQNEIRARTLKDKIRADFFRHYGEMPKDRWVDKLHSDIVVAVKGEMASSSSDE